MTERQIGREAERLRGRDTKIQRDRKRERGIEEIVVYPCRQKLCS